MPFRTEQALISAEKGLSGTNRMRYGGRKPQPGNTEGYRLYPR